MSVPVRTCRTCSAPLPERPPGSRSRHRIYCSKKCWARSCTSVALKTELYDEVAAVALRLDRSVNWVLSDLIRRGLASIPREGR